MNLDEDLGELLVGSCLSGDQPLSLFNSKEQN